MAAKKKSSRSAVAPAATIVKKRNYIVPILLVVLVVVAAVIIFFATRPAPLGTILATVNGQPIYEEDIQEQYRQLPEQYREQYTQDYILNQTVDRTLLLQEAEKRSLTVTDAEVDKQLTTIVDQFGITEGELYDLLEKQNVSIEKYRGLVSEELLLNKIVQEAVLSHVTVTDAEVIAYYESHTSEFSAPANGAIISHILVENETNATAIIKELNNGASFETLAEQYSLDTTSAAGGYLGIITEETPLVEEFKAAAFKLREGQYTRTPVKTAYGYHIILRGADKEPFSLVRDRIQNQLKVEEQVAAFQSFLGNLRSSAKIKYYTQQGVVSAPQAPASGLDAFASCVAQKATLYGTQWSDFYQEQKTMFGDSFRLLTVVDCDEKAHLCAAANVQKYPTWVFSLDDEHTGKLTLKDLAEKTGCVLTS